MSLCGVTTVLDRHLSNGGFVMLLNRRLFSCNTFFFTADIQVGEAQVELTTRVSVSHDSEAAYTIQGL